MKATISSSNLADAFRLIVLEIGEIIPESYRLDASFSSDFGMDSLDMVELIMICEKDFVIHLPDHEWTSLDTPAELLGLIIRKQQASTQDVS